MANSRKRISELPALSVASLDTTFVLGISGSTTYKISINNLTSSLDGAFATDLVTNALSSSLNSKLSTSSFNQYTQSFTASVASGTISGSSQISDLGFVTGSYTTINSFNSLTQSFNSISQSFNVISGSVVSIQGGFDTGSYQTFTSSVNTSISNLNSFTSSQSTSSLVNRLNVIESVSSSWITESETGSFLTSLSGAISSSEQVLGSSGVYSSSAQINGNIYSAGSSFTIQDIIVGAGTTFGKITTDGSKYISVMPTYNTESSRFWANGNVTIQDGGNYVDNGFRLEVSGSTRIVGSLNTTGGITGSTNFDTIVNKPTLISGSSQLTSSYDTRYTLSGSIQPLPSNLLSSSAQITAFGFISSSTTINTSSFATTGSNSFNGNQNITGSLVVSAVAVVAGALTIPSASVISLTSGSSISVDASGAITGSLTGSVFGIGDVVAFSASLNSRIISGSAVAGTISGSSQLTSSYDSRYSLSGSVLTSFSSSVDSRLDTLEASIITGSPNYTQVLGNRRTGITTTGVSIISGSITTTGNPVQIMVTGDANPVNVSSWTRLQIYRNETAIGNIVQVENSSNLNVPYCVNVIDTASAGTYTYSMRTVSGISGLFDFGESMGPTLTMVELNTNTNLPSTNNTFTGTNRFNGQVTLGGAGGDEGGELQLATAQTNSTLTAGVVSVDVYRDRLRIFEGGGNSRGVYIDLSKAPAGNAGELMWKASGMVNAGTFVSLDNIKATVTSGSPYGLSIAAVSTTFSANISAYHAYTGGIAGGQANNQSITTTPTNSLFNWSFITEGDGAYYTIVDKTNSRMYRITMMIGSGFNNNFISIERLF